MECVLTSCSCVTVLTDTCIFCRYNSFAHFSTVPAISLKQLQLASCKYLSSTTLMIWIHLDKHSSNSEECLFCILLFCNASKREDASEATDLGICITTLEKNVYRLATFHNH